MRFAFAYVFDFFGDMIDIRQSESARMQEPCP